MDHVLPREPEPLGDAAGIRPLTYVGKHRGRVAAANILGHHRDADCSAVPRAA